MKSSKFIALLALSTLQLLGCNQKNGEPSEAAASASGAQAAAAAPEPKTLELLNVSYDPTRELWRDINEKFTALYEKETGTKVTIKQSHGGSSTQARAVIDGLEADVVTLASFLDTEAISKKGLIQPGWIDELGLSPGDRVFVSARKARVFVPQCQEQLIV